MTDKASQDRVVSHHTSATLLWSCLTAGLLVGSAWGAVDLLQALITVGGGYYHKTVWMMLVLYTVTASVLAVCLAGLGRLRGWTTGKTWGVTVAVLITVYGLVVVGMLANVHWFPRARRLSGLAANGALLAVSVYVGYVLMRLLQHKAAWQGVLTRVALPLSVAIWLSFLVYGTLAGQSYSVAGSSESAVPPDTSLPNVVVLVVDSLRADHMSSYGYAQRTTPHLDTMAAEGALFEQAYAQTSWTLPSVSSLLTSLYPAYHGANGRWQTLSEEVHTLPELLKQKGYTTAAFSANPFVSHTFGLHQGFDYFYTAQVLEREIFMPFVLAFRLYDTLERRMLGGLQGVRRVVFTLFGFEDEKWVNCERDGMINRELTSWLETHQDRPFFVYVHYMCPHYPYFPPGERKILWQMNVIVNNRSVEEAKRQELIAAYDRTIRHSDTLIQEITAHLQRLRLYDRTLTVVTADHGEEFYEHRGWIHGNTLYNEVTRVPLILRYPPLVQPMQRVSGPAMLVDVLPTVLQVAGISVEHFIHGQNLLTKMQDHANAAWAYSELIGRASDNKAGNIFRALVRGEYKYIKSIEKDPGREQAELYNLQGDAGEQYNLWPLQSDVDQQKWEEDVATFTLSGQGYSGAPAVLSDEMKKRLRALGYVQ